MFFFNTRKDARTFANGTRKVIDTNKTPATTPTAKRWGVKVF